jgi:hypothetical protein
MIFFILEITTQTKECMDLTPQDGTSYKNDWTKVNLNLGPWACTVKLFTAVFLPYLNKLECLQMSVTSTLRCHLEARLELSRVGLPALPINIRLGWKLLTIANTLSYYSMTKHCCKKYF